jgi:hypothetical protein
MKMFLTLAAASAVLVGCGRNEPGTMGGEPGVPETVATGAPAQAAKETSHTDRRQPALAQEHAASTFDDPAATNAPIPTQPPQSDTTKRKNE